MFLQVPLRIWECVFSCNQQPQCYDVKEEVILGLQLKHPPLAYSIEERLQNGSVRNFSCFTHIIVSSVVKDRKMINDFQKFFFAAQLKLKRFYTLRKIRHKMCPKWDSNPNILKYFPSFSRFFALPRFFEFLHFSFFHVFR